jgi:hypothetical protein
VSCGHKSIMLHKYKYITLRNHKSIALCKRKYIMLQTQLNPFLFN